MFDEDVYNTRVKRTTGHVSQQGNRVFSLHAFAIGAVAARGIIKIDDRDNSCHQGNGFPAKPFGISSAIPFFVVIADDVFNGIGEVNTLEDIAAHGGMNFYLGKFSLSKFSG